MTGIEVRGATPEEIERDLDRILRTNPENKYAFLVGLKDLDFDINEDLLALHGMILPFQSINQAEQALRVKVITPQSFLEYDGLEHQVLVFDPRPIGFSGFMGCVTHSLSVTNQGLFEVGRYPAINMSTPNRHWQWFLHRRLVTVDEINELEENQSLTAEQFVENIYQDFIHG
jgi:hypothetical protein